MLRAIVESPCNGVYRVKFYYVIISDNKFVSDQRDFTRPEIFIPCASYEQACAVADAYNAQ